MATAIWSATKYTPGEVNTILGLSVSAAEFIEDEWSKYGASDEDVHPHYGGDRFNEAGEVIFFAEDLDDRVSDYIADRVGDMVMLNELPEENHHNIAYEATRQVMLAYDIAALEGEYYDWEGNLLETFQPGTNTPKASVMGMVLSTVLNICEAEKRLLSEGRYI